MQRGLDLAAALYAPLSIVIQVAYSYDGVGRHRGQPPPVVIVGEVGDNVVSLVVDELQHGRGPGHRHFWQHPKEGYVARTGCHS